MPAPQLYAPFPATAETPSPEGEDALRAEVIASLDHDLRTSLTTVMGALQTMAHPDLAPADPELAQLLSSARAQAQRMRRLLDELPGAASPGGGEPLTPAELAHLIRRASDTDDGTVGVDIPGDLGPVLLFAPGLYRALAGILTRARGGSGWRVAVTADGSACRFVILRQDATAPAVPQSSVRIVAAMGGRIETTEEAGTPALCLVLPAARGASAG